MKRDAISLSTNQEQVIRAFCYGLHRVDVATELDISVEVVDKIVAEAYNKLHLLEKHIHRKAKIPQQTYEMAL